MPALLGLDWINWDACALQLRDNCITEIYLLLKVSPPPSSIRMRSYAESHRICRKVGMAGSTHGLCMSLCAVQVFLFSSVTSSAVACGGGPFPAALCRVCNVGMTIPPVGRGDWCLLITVLLIIKFWGFFYFYYLILVLWRGQNAHLSVWVIPYDHLQIDSSVNNKYYFFTPNRPEALLGWHKAQRNRVFYLIFFSKL